MEQQKQERRSFYKLVGALVLPMALQNLINVGVTSADVVMLGIVGDDVLAAASLAGQVQFILTLIFFGLTSGAAVLTAQYWGKGDTRTIEKVLGITLRFAILIAVLFMAVVWIFPAPVMRIFTPEQALIELGVPYLRIIAVSYLFTAVTTVYLNLMRSVERVVVSTVIYLISLLANIALNAVFIFGLLGVPAMGIRGAAVASVIARALELVLMLVYAFAVNKTIRLRWQDVFVRDKPLFRDFLTYSVPVVANELLWGAALATNAVIIGHLGVAAVAANAAAQVVRQLATVVAFGIANATAILVGKAIGENNEAKAQLYAGRLIKLSVASGIGGAALILLIRPFVLKMLSLTPEAAGYLSVMLLVICYYVICQSFNTTLIVGVFRGGGDTRYGLFVDVTTMWCFSILLGALGAFVFEWSVPVVYVLLLSDEIAKIGLSAWRYKSKKWLRNVTRERQEAL